MREVTDKIKGFLLGIEPESIYFKVLNLIVKMLLKLNPEFEISKYEIINNFVLIELINRDLSEYISIEVTGNNVEIRGDGYEILHFFDNEQFKFKYKDLIVSFFKGEYKILSYHAKGGRKEAFGIIWNSENLASFNNEKERINFFRKRVEQMNIKDGINLIK